ncbi:Ig-like domain repeat protein [Candidatus Sumerlaeota bacterium]|nr:Ig-like domain repeat protein [Candidatus Sumerlaeota bacterium]
MKGKHSTVCGFAAVILFFMMGIASFGQYEQTFATVNFGGGLASSSSFEICDAIVLMGSGGEAQSGEDYSISSPTTVEPTTSTVTTLTMSKNPADSGSYLTLTATVTVVETSSEAPAAAPAGSVLFYMDSGYLGSAPLDAQGVAQYVVLLDSIGVGSHTVYASYGGSGGYGSSDDTDTLEVVAAVPVIELTTTPTPVYEWFYTTILGSVSAEAAGTTPTGTVSLLEYGTTLTVQTLDGDGGFSYDLGYPSPGAHEIVAVYSGDVNYDDGVTTFTFDVLPLPQSVVVTLVEDEDDDDYTTGDLSLREALEIVDWGGTITFAPNVTGVTTLTLGQLDIWYDVSIIGPGADVLALDGDYNNRVMWIGTEGYLNVYISGLTFQHGDEYEDEGGGICAYYTDLTLEDCVIRENGWDLDVGGGIYLYESWATLNNCEITENFSYYEGGGIYLEYTMATLNNCEITSNISEYYGGGGIYHYEGSSESSSDTLVIRRCLIDGNITWEGYGGGIYIDGGLFGEDDAPSMAPARATPGGGSYGSVEMLPGGAYITESVISNNYSYVFSYEGGWGGGMELDGAACYISDSRISNNATMAPYDYYEMPGGGGGVDVYESYFAAERCTFDGNNADEGFGGAILNDAYGYPSLVQLTDCTISSNSATYAGGGVMNWTVYGPTAPAEDGVLPASMIMPYYPVAYAVMTNCTVVGNVIDNSGWPVEPPYAIGAGLHDWVEFYGGDGDTVNAPVSKSSVPEYLTTQTFTLENCIVAGNYGTTDTWAVYDVGTDYVFISNGHNLIGNMLDDIGFTTATEQLTVPLDEVIELELADHGGFAPTHALFYSSPAYNTGDNDAVTTVMFDGPPYLDQTGMPRIIFGTVDIGAVEYAPPEIGVDPLTLDFGSQNIDDGPVTLEVLIASAGADELVFTTGGVYLTGSNAFQFDPLPDLSPMDPGTTRTWSLTFDPYSVGTLTAQLIILSNAVTSPSVTVSMTGEGITAEIGVDPMTLNFGERDVDDGAAALDLTISSVGTDDLEFTSGGVYVTSALGQFALDPSADLSPMAPGTTRTWQLTFDPSTTGVSGGSLTINSNAQTSPTVVVILTGVGTQGPQITILRDVSVVQGGNEITTAVAQVSDTEDPAGSLSIDMIRPDVPGLAVTLTNNGGIIEAVVQADAGVSTGVYTITVIVMDSDEQTAEDSFDITVLSPLLARYFADGQVNIDDDNELNFETFLMIFNPDESETAEIEITLYFESGDPVVLNTQAAPMQRRTINLGNALAQLDLHGVLRFGIRLLSTNNVPIVTERSMYWNPGGIYRAAGTSSAGAAELSNIWLLGEGSTTLNRQTELAMMNPSATDSVVRIRWLPEDGAMQDTITTVSARSRVTINAADIVGVDNFSAEIVSTNEQPIVVERTMHGPAYGIPRFWGHTVLAHPSASPEWLFCEGATHSNFETFFTIGNPTSDTVTVNLDFTLPGGTAVNKQVEIPAYRRYTVITERDYPELTDQPEFFTRISSAGGEDIIAERSVYFSLFGGDRNAGAANLGATAARPMWLMAEGAVGGGSLFETFILVSNPNDAAVDVEITLFPDNVPNETINLTIDPHRRATVKANDYLPGDLGTVSFAILVRSTGGENIIAERVMYFQGGLDVPRAGSHCSSGVAP